MQVRSSAPWALQGTPPVRTCTSRYAVTALRRILASTLRCHEDGPNSSAQHEQVERGASDLLVRRVLHMLHRQAKTLFPSKELVLGEAAHRGVGVAIRIQLLQQVREARRV